MKFNWISVSDTIRIVFSIEVTAVSFKQVKRAIEELALRFKTLEIWVSTILVEEVDKDQSFSPKSLLKIQGWKVKS
jgi:hypothetical protein